MFKRNHPPVNIDAGDVEKTNWLKQHKKLTIIIVSLAIILVAGGTFGAFYFLNQKTATTTATTNKPAKKAVVETPKPVLYYSQLTGAQVASEAATKQPVTAIMIENSPDSRPQSGLKNSGVVFEAIAEGGITRFLALYQEQKPQLIGPVRSLRMYYVDWLAAFNASVVHVGGSAAALSEVRSGRYRDIDQFFNASTYWRATDRYAPHNVYTSFEKIDAINAKKGYTESSFTGFSRKEESNTNNPTNSSSLPAATAIDVKISSALFNSRYDYDSATNSYNRSQAGKPHIDREDGQISPKVVVILKVTESTVIEDGYRENINSVGQGSAVIFQNGTVQEVSWRKNSKNEQITFTDGTGNNVALARGQTWITAVPVNKGGGVSWQ